MLVATLDDEDRAHVARFRFETDRTQAIASRGLVRHALSAATPIACEAWRFARGPQGRPSVIAPGTDAPVFSAANCRTQVGCAIAVAGTTLGFDLEPMPNDAILADLALAARCFTAVERAWLNDGPRAERFAQLWTGKEAVVKALGLGLAASLQAIELRPTAHGLAVCLDDDAMPWWLASWQVDPTHWASVCGRGPRPTVAVRVLAPPR